ncbi:MAG: EAL domain-containing protein [Azoarcus sp.]|nr:EAL domain-containing protein [Azoarcus sp.]
MPSLFFAGGTRRLSLRRLAFWVPAISTLALVAGVAIVVVLSLSVIGLAQRGGGQAAAQQMEALRAVGNLERLIALGDHFSTENDPDAWRNIGLTMQAMAVHPSIGASANHSDGVRETFDTVATMIALRHRENASVLTADALAMLKHEREVLWQTRRTALKDVADQAAVRLVNEHSRAAEEISRGATRVLLMTLGGALIVAISGFTFIVLVHGYLIMPLLGLSDYLRHLRKSTEGLPALPSVRGEELGEVVDAIGALAESQRALEHAALHDPLTGLSNRYGLEARLDHAIANARRHGKQLAVMFVDLDRFKTINDSFGHACGDGLLRILSDRFGTCLRDTDLIARLGGDEFVVVANELDHASDAIPVARKLMEAASRELCVEATVLRMSASVGIALFPDNGEDVSTLMKHADIAMYHAKAVGRANFQFFDAEMNASVAERLDVETSLLDALRREEFVLYYQPQMSPDGRRIIAAEALIRWQRSDGRITSPAAFIPIAEECGLILPIGQWVLRNALGALRDWRARGLQEVRLAVNLSLIQLRDDSLPALVARLLQEYGVPPELLELEITESVAMREPEQMVRTLCDLKALGVSLAIDDFGTGYSSLAYLKLFPIDRLKLDRAFVSDIESDSNDASICAATAGLAHSLRLQVVAEGVETQAQFEFLQTLGCDLLQGYYFHKPMPVAELERLLGESA